MRILVLINPKAGLSRRRKAPMEQIESFFAGSPHEVEIRASRARGDFDEWAHEAARQDYDLVVAAGGDGTVHEVLNGLANTDTEMGILPLGTENVLAREVGIPTDLGAACQRLLDGAPHHFDLIRANDRYFGCFAGIGFDAWVAERLDQKLKAQLGAGAYLIGSVRGIMEYRSGRRRVRLEVDDGELEVQAWLLAVANIKTYGGGLRPAPLANFDDGLIDVCVFEDRSYGECLRQMVAVRQGRHLELKSVHYFQTERCRLTMDPPTPYHLDGEPTGATPLEFEACPGALSLRY